MKVLYIYPHPDDESFGPAQVMSFQRREGHEVYLLTLTKGGATKQRHRLGLSIEAMGDIRYREMLDVARVLDLTGMTVLDLPDSDLKELDPRVIEDTVHKHIEGIRPDVVVTYAVHGISGFHDHLVTHATVKRVYVELRDREIYPRRLAFVTITEEQAAASPHYRLNGSKPEEIDCVCTVDDIDMQKHQAALDCYTTFQETIRQSGIRDMIGRTAVFEFYRENFDPPLKSLFEKLTTT